ncbi:SRPBCC family protein [Schlesneria paludicola]|uniref:SRPBCC family protein n=1 Tax=Schlesneria paludicola TaxID=360056 RepID=UPI000299D503|nr:SRPBCC family protein [Schlesneria paludicola]
MELITISPHPTQRGTYRLSAEQWLPRPLDEVFEFFADAYRLQDLTPPFLNFQVLTPRPVDMFAGTTIDYRLKLHGIPIRWRSEITEWQPPLRFVDRQLKGPYRLWNHLHTFEMKDGGTLVRDIVDYAVPGGALIHWLMVRRDLMRIFEYRHGQLASYFGAGDPPSATASAK